jgi:hypothetical protein
VFTKLDGEAVKRTGVQPLKEPFDNELRAKIQPFDLIDHFRLEIFLDRHRQLPQT